MRIRVSIFATIILMSASTLASAQSLYRCTIQDGVYFEAGKFVRNSLVSSRVSNYNPIIVDTVSGVFRRGNLAPQRWIIAQRATSDAFFKATMHAAPGMANDRFTLKPQFTPITFVYYYEDSMVFTGTCEVVN